MIPFRLKEVTDVCKVVRKRGPEDVLNHLVLEVAELSKEIYSTVPVGEDGVIGESVDIMLCCLDMIWLEKPDITEEEIISVVRRKLKKWKDKYS